jgi:hypothetical protein
VPRFGAFHQFLVLARPDRQEVASNSLGSLDPDPHAADVDLDGGERKVFAPGWLCGKLIRRSLLRGAV